MEIPQYYTKPVLWLWDYDPTQVVENHHQGDKIYFISHIVSIMAADDLL